jgi:hypothetical protein
MPYVLQPDDLTTAKIAFTDQGGIAIKLTNKTGAATVKGSVVTAGTADNGVILVPVNIPNPIGVFYEDDVAADAEAWVVIAGIADVLFSGATTRGHLARTSLNVDTTAQKVAGKALSEAVPTSPFSDDKHFCEIGHVLETKAEAGLAKVVLHFN